MARIEIRIDDDEAASFAKAFPGRGDRSAVLRRAIQTIVANKTGRAGSVSVEQETEKPSKEELMVVSPKGRRRTMRADQTLPVSVRLTAEQYLGIENKAGQLCMETSPYIRALVDAHLGRNPAWPKENRAELTAATTQLRKAGVNLNQLTFLIRASLLENVPFPVAEDELAQVLAAVETLKTSIVRVIENRDQYWQTKGDRDG